MGINIVEPVPTIWDFTLSLSKYVLVQNSQNFGLFLLQKFKEGNKMAVFKTEVRCYAV